MKHHNYIFLRNAFSSYNIFDFVICHICRLKCEMEQGAQIGAHLHYEYIEPNKVWDKRVEDIRISYVAGRAPNLAALYQTGLIPNFSLIKYVRFFIFSYSSSIGSAIHGNPELISSTLLSHTLFGSMYS